MEAETNPGRTLNLRGLGGSSFLAGMPRRDSNSVGPRGLNNSNRVPLKGVYKGYYKGMYDNYSAAIGFCGWGWGWRGRTRVWGCKSSVLSWRLKACGT